ncbi:MAG: transposase family protein, partial [Culicoidibacterales bacterium]
MNIQDFFPDKFQITAIEQRITDIIISLQSQFQSANCPKCQSISRKIHSTYFRKVMDSSILSKPVKLHIQVQKFFC